MFSTILILDIQNHFKWYYIFVVELRIQQPNQKEIQLHSKLDALL